MSDRKRLQVWLDETEFEFIQSYAKENHLMISELVRGWIHETMKREGYNIKEPTLPESVKKKNQTSKSEKLKIKRKLGASNHGSI